MGKARYIIDAMSIKETQKERKREREKVERRMKAK